MITQQKFLKMMEIQDLESKFPQLLPPLPKIKMMKIQVTKNLLQDLESKSPQLLPPLLKVWKKTKVRNIWVFSPLVPSKRVL